MPCTNGEAANRQRGRNAVVACRTHTWFYLAQHIRCRGVDYNHTPDRGFTVVQWVEPPAMVQHELVQHGEQ